MNSFSIESRKALETLKAGGTILYPTDTVWGIGCDATDPEAVKKVYDLKQRPYDQPMICLVSEVFMLKDYVDISEEAMDVIGFAEKPTTIIYHSPVGVAGNLIAPDGTLAVRIVYDEFCRQLIRELGKPLVSTSANLNGQPTPESFQEISEEILKGVDYVVNLYHHKKCNQPSSIVKLNKDGRAEVIRE